MSAKRNIQECTTPPKRNQRNKNPKNENLAKTADPATTSPNENIIQRKEWSVQNLEEFENFFFLCGDLCFLFFSFLSTDSLFKIFQKIIRKMKDLEKMLIPDHFVEFSMLPRLLYFFVSNFV